MSFLTPVEEPVPTVTRKRVGCFAVFDTSGEDALPIILQTFSQRATSCDFVVTAIDTWLDASLKRTYTDELHLRDQASSTQSRVMLLDLLPNRVSIDVACSVDLAETQSVARLGYVNKRGVRNTSPEVQSVWCETVLQKTDLAIVNHQEAGSILKRSVETVSQMKDAAKALFDAGGNGIVITGGHLDGIVRDYCFDGSGLYEFGADQVRSVVVGAGAFHAAVIVDQMVRGADVLSAIEHARNAVTLGIENAFAGARGLVVDSTVRT